MRELIVVRHAISEDREAFAATGRPDDERPLTEKGRKRMKRGARGLRRLVSDVLLVATSPLARARQTAGIVAEAYGGIPVVALPALLPGAPPEDLMTWLNGNPAEGPVAVVGHEPHLGEWVAWALTGRGRPVLPMRKGGACRLVFDDLATAGGMRLDWFLTPRQLRNLGARR